LVSISDYSLQERIRKTTDIFRLIITPNWCQPSVEGTLRRRGSQMSTTEVFLTFGGVVVLLFLIGPVHGWVSDWRERRHRRQVLG